MNKTVLFIVVNILIFGCKGNVDIEKQKEITNLSQQLFQQKQIDFSKTLELIKEHTTSKKPDGSNFMDIYSNTSANICFKVYENPKGKIEFMSYHINDKEIYAAEYFDNGIIMCKFNTSREGIRNGDFECYFKNGKIRTKGKYLNNLPVGIQTEYDSIGNIKNKIDYSKI